MERSDQRSNAGSMSQKNVILVMQKKCRIKDNFGYYPFRLSQTTQLTLVLVRQGQLPLSVRPHVEVGGLPQVHGGEVGVVSFGRGGEQGAHIRVCCRLGTTKHLLLIKYQSLECYLSRI